MKYSWNQHNVVINKKDILEYLHLKLIFKQRASVDDILWKASKMNFS